MLSKKMAIALALVLLFILSAVLLPSPTRQGPEPHPAAGVVLTIFGPFQEVAALVAGFTVSTWETYFDLVSTSRENHQLKNELAKAQESLNRLDETKRQNDRLRELLGFARQAERKIVTALVIAEDPSEWYNAIIINRGEADGVRKGLAVVTHHGVVGKVINTGYRYSQVLLITDPNSAMDARIARTRARGILEGARQGRCGFKYVMRQQEVTAGDMVVTSGMDRVFPPGLAVGTVEKTFSDGQSMFQEIVVSPHVDFSKLEEVLVILSAEKAFELDLQ